MRGRVIASDLARDEFGIQGIQGFRVQDLGFRGLGVEGFRV